MTDNKGEKKMANKDWIDISKHDAVLVISLAIIVGFLMFLGMSMA